MKKLVITLIALLLFGFAIYTAVNILFFREGNGVEKIFKTLAVKRDLRQEVRGSGIVVSQEQVEIVTKVPGKIRGFQSKVGDYVNKDQVLYTIENDDVDNEYNLAKAEYEKAKVEQDKLKSSPDPARVLESKNALSKAEVAYKEMEENIKLKERLFEEGFVSQKEYDDLANKLKFSKNEYELAKSRYDDVSKPASAEEIDLSEAKLKKLKIQLDDIQERIDGRKVTSPISGTIVDIKIDESLLKREEKIPAGTAVMTLANLKENLFVDGEIYESDINNLKIGQDVFVFFSQKNESYKARITEISLVAKSYGTVRKFPVEIEIIDDISSFVKLGMRVSFNIVIAEKKQVLTLPLTYIYSTPSGKKVLIKKGGNIVFAPIVTGIYNDQFIEVTSGISEHQEVFLNRPGEKEIKKKQGTKGVAYRKT